jgi:hypothetical protein
MLSTLTAPTARCKKGHVNSFSQGWKELPEEDRWCKNKIPELISVGY